MYKDNTTVGSITLIDAVGGQELSWQEAIDGDYISVNDGTLFSASKTREIAKIVIPNGVFGIGEDTFSSCAGLLSLAIPISVTSIALDAFFGCSRLASISVDKGNPVYDSRDNCNAIIKTKSSTLICGCQNTVIPNGVTDIGIGAFLSCEGLESLSIPDSVTSIWDWAFLGCTRLTSIMIPQYVDYIGSRVFSGCDNLASIVVDPNNTLYNSLNDCNAIIRTATHTLVCGCKNTVIPINVSRIGVSAFSDCSELTSIVIPQNVIAIDGNAFSGCTGLQKVIIPNSVTYIDSNAFFGCNQLKSITIPKKLFDDGYTPFGLSGKSIEFHLM